MTVNSIIGSKKIIETASDFSNLSKIVFTSPVRLTSTAIAGVYNNQYEIANIHTLYVDALNGSDDNSGTDSSIAFKTIDAAIKIANKYIKDYVTINVASGNYVMSIQSRVNTILSLASDASVNVNDYKLSNLLEIRNGKLTANGATNFFNVINSASVKIVGTSIEMGNEQNLFNSYEQSVINALFANVNITGTAYLFNSSIQIIAIYSTSKTITQTTKHNNVKLVTMD